MKTENICSGIGRRDSQNVDSFVESRYLISTVILVLVCKDKIVAKPFSDQFFRALITEGTLMGGAPSGTVPSH